MVDITKADKTVVRRGIFSKKIPQEPVKPQKEKKHFSFGLRKPSVKISIKNKKKFVISMGLFVLVIGAGIGVGIYYYLYQNNPSVIYAHKLKTLTQQVSKYVPLPSDETPVTATVTDVKQLPNEPFFKLAQNGDKILMYKKHQLAILYRPGTGQVITRATLDFKDVTPTPVQQQVAGASTSATISSVDQLMPTVTPKPYHPDGKILVAPQQ